MTLEPGLANDDELKLCGLVIIWSGKQLGPNCPVLRNSLRKRQRHELSRQLASRDRDDDVLLAVDHVAHWRAARACRQLHLPGDLATLLVECTEHVAAAAVGKTD